MKKLRFDFCNWLLRQCSKKHALKLSITRRRRHRNRSRFSEPHRVELAAGRKQKHPKRTGHEVLLPEKMDVEENFVPTIRNLNKVRAASRHQLKLSYLNFDNIRHISPSAALVLASEVDRWNESRGGRLKATDANWHPPIKKLLCEMRLFELLRLEKPKDAPTEVSTTFLPFLRGDVDERTNAGANAKQLRQLIEKAAGTAIRRHLLSDGLTEAATNVCHHAYRRKGRNKKRYKPYWMAGAFDSETQRVTVCFYDHGLTIPGTVPASEKLERWKNRMGTWDDGQRIRAAMTLGRTSTGKHGRGKGLRNLLEVVSGHQVSRLTIWSRLGKLVVANRGSGKLSFHSEQLETPLNGTLIEWQFVPNTATDNPPDAYLHR